MSLASQGTGAIFTATNITTDTHWSALLGQIRTAELNSLEDRITLHLLRPAFVPSPSQCSSSSGETRSDTQKAGGGQLRLCPKHYCRYVHWEQELLGLMTSSASSHSVAGPKTGVSEEHHTISKRRNPLPERQTAWVTFLPEPEALGLYLDREAEGKLLKERRVGEDILQATPLCPSPTGHAPFTPPRQATPPSAVSGDQSTGESSAAHSCHLPPVGLWDT